MGPENEKRRLGAYRVLIRSEREVRRQDPAIQALVVLMSHARPALPRATSWIRCEGDQNHAGTLMGAGVVGGTGFEPVTPTMSR